MAKALGKHKDRTHAQWSASSTERNWLCAGNLALSMDIVRSPESKAAAWGTACHEIAERLLNGAPVEIGDKFETEKFVFYADLEMLDTANAYVGYIRHRQTMGYSLYAVEQQFDLAKLGELGMECGGTVDTMLYNADTEDLEVVDLKTGKGHIVEATGNPQARTYAVGALLQMDMDPTPVSTVTTTIVQPRAQHRDGTIRSETIGVIELLDWTIELATRIRTTATALKVYSDARDSGVKMEAWASTYLNPGEIQCTFCPAAGSCPALRREALTIAGAWEDDSGVHYKSNQFRENSVEDVERDLDRFEELEAWIRERKALAHEMARQGFKFDHWQLVEKIGHRKFTVGAEEIAGLLPIPPEHSQLYDYKLKSPAGFERSLGKAVVAEFLGDVIERPVIGTDLIRSSQTTREPVLSVVDRYFVEPVEPMETYDGTGK
jgi:hypothetical protein